MVVVGFCLVWGDWQTNRRRPVWDGLSMARALAPCLVGWGVAVDLRWRKKARRLARLPGGWGGGLSS